MTPVYIEINDGSELWDDVRQQVIDSVPVEEFDRLVEIGYIDLDGMVIADIDINDLDRIAAL